MLSDYLFPARRLPVTLLGAALCLALPTAARPVLAQAWQPIPLVTAASR